MPTGDGSVVCDLLALRAADHSTSPVVIELKSAQEKARLVDRLEGYADFVDAHADGYAQLFAVLLGRRVEFTAACERWIVWPSAGRGSDRHEAALGGRAATLWRDELRSRFRDCIARGVRWATRSVPPSAAAILHGTEVARGNEEPAAARPAPGQHQCARGNRSQSTKVTASDPPARRGCRPQP